MKNTFLLFIFLLTFCVTTVYSQSKPIQILQEETNEPVKLEISFDWVNMSQVQRDEKIKKYHDILFFDDNSKVSKKNFKNQYKDFKKDLERKEHYRRAKNGVIELEDCFLCAFFKNDILIIYGVQYKKDLRHAYYYDGFGNLRYVDIMSGEYPNFPYTSKQYRNTGKLVSAIVFENHDVQYMYNPNGTFRGLWYKEKMFDEKGKQILTRTNW